LLESDVLYVLNNDLVQLVSVTFKLHRRNIMFFLIFCCVSLKSAILDIWLQLSRIKLASMVKVKIFLLMLFVILLFWLHVQGQYICLHDFIFVQLLHKTTLLQEELVAVNKTKTYL